MKATLDAPLKGPSCPAVSVQVPDALRDFLAGLPAVVYHCGPPPNFPTTFVSDNVLAQFGYKAEEFYADPFFWTQHVHEADRTRILAKLDSIGSADVFSYEYRFQRIDGDYAWLHDQVHVLRDDEARIQGLVGSWFDISQRKRLEMLQSGQAQILDSLVNRRSLGETLTQIVQMLEDQNPEMVCSILRFDAATQTLRHGAARRLPEEYCRMVDGLGIGPAMGSCGTAAFRRQRVIVTDTLRDPLWANYRSIASAFGLRACWSQPIMSSSNHLLGTYAIYYREPRGPSPGELALIEQAAGLAALAIERFHDEETLRHTERLVSLGTLSAGIAHEINNPIGAIQLAVQGAMNALAQGNLERVRGLLNGIAGDAERCTTIVRGVLQFGRRNKGDEIPVQLREVLRSACGLTHPHAVGLGAMVDASLIDLDVSVMGRAVELEQVFVNVIRNAVESKEHGARVTIQLAADPDVARVIVSDDGRGMTDEQQARIFEPFFTARPNRGGTGLGMSIAHGIVARHGGVIRVFSKLHKGTTVVVCLPRRLV